MSGAPSSFSEVPCRAVAARAECPGPSKRSPEIDAPDWYRIVNRAARPRTLTHPDPGPHSFSAHIRISERCEVALPPQGYHPPSTGTSPSARLERPGRRTTLPPANEASLTNPNPPSATAPRPRRPFPSSPRAAEPPHRNPRHNPPSASARGVTSTPANAPCTRPYRPREHRSTSQIRKSPMPRHSVLSQRQEPTWPPEPATIRSRTRRWTSIPSTHHETAHLTLPISWFGGCPRDGAPNITQRCRILV